MTIQRFFVNIAFLHICLWLAGAAQDSKPASSAAPPMDPSAAVPKSISSNPGFHYDFDIVYVRAPRPGDDRQILWTDVLAPYQAEPESDLVLLHPDGTEDVLVKAGKGAVSDPVVSFDGQWIYYALYQYASPTASGLLQSKGADIYKINVKTKETVALTKQEFTPNTGVIEPSMRTQGVYNLGPCPLPGGKVMFTSTRNGLVATKSYKGFSAYEEYTKGDYKVSQLFIMDDDGKNVEQIGYMNSNGALNPTVLTDGRIVFSSFESQGMRDPRGWALFTIHGDGTQWMPLFSALGGANEQAHHFAAQRSDGHIVAEIYYFQHNHGFGSYFEMDQKAPEGEAYFGSASPDDPRNIPYERSRKPFSPRGLRELTPFSIDSNRIAKHTDPKDTNSPFLGKVTHPAPAPDNYLLTLWSPGPVYGIIHTGLHRFMAPAVDSGIYLMPGNVVIDSPSQLYLIKNDPKYNEKFPRAVVPYKRIYGVDEPVNTRLLANDGSRHPQLPAGTPYALFGASTLYKRESYPRGKVLPGTVTATFSGGDDAHENLGALAGLGGNWFGQGADTCKYDNSEIHAIRILGMEPTTDPLLAGRASRRWWNMANERFRVLGEVPVRKFNNNEQPIDPDGNPDTSFLMKLPADVPWTVQTLDKDGMVLNMAQTWHMLRPGEVRNNCGGCHAHSQVATPFESTAAAKDDYKIFDLTKKSLWITTKEKDTSGRKWDAADTSGLREDVAAKTVEYTRDIKPILERSCVACHTKNSEKPAGNLVMDDDETLIEITSGRFFDLLVDRPPLKVPGTYMRLAADSFGMFGNPSGISTKLASNIWGHPQGSRYVRYMQARRSLLIWKIFGRRMDGFKNEDFAYQTEPGNVDSMVYKGKPFDIKKDMATTPGAVVDVAFIGSIMPPPKALDGTYTTRDGKKIHVAPLSDEDRRMFARWIDLGCPIDLYNSSSHTGNNGGWFDDETRPTLTLQIPSMNSTGSFDKITVGMCDYDSGLDLKTFSVTANFPINGLAAGENLSKQFEAKDDVWTLPIKSLAPIDASTKSPRRQIVVSVRDLAGNITKVERVL